MPAYAIGHISIKDPKKWVEYRDRVPATLAPWGGEIVFHGRRLDVFSGEHAYSDVVVLRFPDAEAGFTGWYASRAYQALIPLRDQAAEVLLVNYEA
jgi:uncharacterized protein (DUF1330 family)